MTVNNEEAAVICCVVELTIIGLKVVSRRANECKGLAGMNTATTDCEMTDTLFGEHRTSGGAAVLVSYRT